MMTPAGYNVHSLAFGEGGIEISYSRTHESDAGTGIQEIDTVIVPAHHIADALDEVLDSCDQLITAIGVVRRQPVATRQR